MGNKRFDSLFDYSRNGCDLQVSCRCGHVATLNPTDLSRDCIRNGLDTRIAAIKRRLKCSACANREVAVGPAKRPKA